MSPGSNTESYPAFAHIGLMENPGKNLNQSTCPDRESNPGYLDSRLDALTTRQHFGRRSAAIRAVAFRQVRKIVFKVYNCFKNVEEQNAAGHLDAGCNVANVQETTAEACGVD
ncbi:hypothetical protein ANN_02615 [Periplaneta americana]|uniref:Uncharacterized protein n=1 Tax=Periplaneta americana TaxID=6978 RepID=A0ABQ8TZB4_PERAM|nr:hypothetical protein ANN_02615 [Periplaneta americana]